MKKLLIVLVLLSFVLTGCSGDDENQVRSHDGVKMFRVKVSRPWCLFMDGAAMADTGANKSPILQRSIKW